MLVPCKFTNDSILIVLVRQGDSSTKRATFEKSFIERGMENILGKVYLQYYTLSPSKY